MDTILHHIETMGCHCFLVFTGESSFQGFLGGAGFRPSTVGLAFTSLRDSTTHGRIRTSGFPLQTPKRVRLDPKTQPTCGVALVLVDARESPSSPWCKGQTENRNHLFRCSSIFTLGFFWASFRWLGCTFRCPSLPGRNQIQ